MRYFKLHIFLLFILNTTLGFANEATAEKAVVDLVEDNSLSLDFEFEDLICDQASKSKCKRIKKEARFKPGQKISDKDLRNAKIRIQLLGLFKDVNLNLKKGSQKGKVIVAVETSDRSPIYTIIGVQAGARNTRGDKELEGNTDFTIGHRDIFGTGKNLSLSARSWGRTETGSTTGSLLLRYSDPNLLDSRKWFFNTELFANQEDFVNYNGNSFIGSIEVGRRYGNFSYWTLGYGRGYSKIDRLRNTSGTYNEDVLLLGYGYNTQDDLYFPTSGTRINLKLALDVNSGISGSLSEDDVISVADSNFDWRTTYRLNHKLFLTWFLESRNNQFEQDDFLNDGLGFELGYQTVRNRKGTDLSDLRYYVAPSVNGYSSWDGLGVNLNAGVKLRSKNYGLVRLGVFWSQR